MTARASSGDEELHVVVPAALDGQRVDRALAMVGGLTRKVAAELVAAGAVRVDGRVLSLRSTTLRTGQALDVRMPAPRESGPVPDPSVPFVVVHEDDDLVVVDKPAGVVVHHGAGHDAGTLVDGLAARYRDLAASAGTLGDRERPGIVHRLDKGTSGLLVVARSPAAFASLSDQLRTHRAERSYLALVVGRLPDDAGVVDAPMARSTRRPDRMAVRAGGRPARTRYRVRRRYGEPVACTLVEIELETGRTHQVRVHMAAIGHPVVGDDRYDPARARPAQLVARMAPGRLFLHAWRLAVDHPRHGHMSWESPLPPDLAGVLESLVAEPPGP